MENFKKCLSCGDGAKSGIDQAVPNPIAVIRKAKQMASSLPTRIL